MIELHFLYGYLLVAKEQGLRSRAAFKLSQINRHYPTLLNSQTNVVLDLCAAPGGWTQIVGRTCGAQTTIIAVDILPIRSLGKQRNIVTIVGDITTDKCKADINRSIKDNAAATAANANANNHRNGVFVDVVLHDGAPNVGASYDKDAYEQTELAVHALKCATQHLRKNGSFVTKIYRSRDSASYQWVLNQLFDEVTTFKPKASRQQSAEIFYIAQGYYKPDKIDPRLLDPKHIFEFVEGDTSAGGAAGGATGGLGAEIDTKKFNVFHKSWETANKRKRGGYDTEQLEFASLRRIAPVTKFVFETKSQLDAIQILSTCTGLSFTTTTSTGEEAQDGRRAVEDPRMVAKNKFLLNHPFTTTEIKTCIVDLKLLNKGDFKGLVLWRDKMIAIWKEKHEHEEGEKEGNDADAGEESNSDASDDDGEDETKTQKKAAVGDEDDDDNDDDEDQIQKEIQKARERKLKEKKRAKKKDKKKMMKKRKQAAFGMDLNAIDIEQQVGDGKFFSLKDFQNAQDLHDISEVNLDRVTEEQAFGKPDSDSDDEDRNTDAYRQRHGLPEKDDETGYSYRNEADLDAAYDTFLKNTKNSEAKIGTKAAKRSKKLMREKMAEQSHEDHELLLSAKQGISADAKTYAKLLSSQQGSDDDDDDYDEREDDVDNDDDGFDTEPLTPAQHQARQNKKTEAKNKNKNPLIREFLVEEDPTSIKTARWFSNPLFAKIGEAVNAATEVDVKDTESNTNSDYADDDDYDNEDESTTTTIINDKKNDTGDADDASNSKSKKKNNKKKKDATKNNTKPKKDDDTTSTKEKKLTADDVLAMMPKTDKQIRHEKRIKAKERDERRQNRRAKKMGEEVGGGTDNDFDLVPLGSTADKNKQSNGDYEYDNDELMEKMEGMSDEKKKKIIEARRLIKAGMGTTSANNGGKKGGTKNGRNVFEVVDQEDDDDDVLPAIVDDRKYDSDHMDYDSDDYAETMALGTMMLRHSKAKALVDASYNRFAWNDPAELPEWFVDDESRHYRPNLPIPPALIAKMKEKQMQLSMKPIAKVAEARARKNRKAKSKLAAAKKAAQSVANSSEMSETMKLKSISKALRSNDNNNGKKYVVAKKGQGKKGVKGSVMVDTRQKSDKRGMERAAKKRKNGKKGGLTGSKRRRNHK